MQTAKTHYAKPSNQRCAYLLTPKKLAALNPHCPEYAARLCAGWYFDDSAGEPHGPFDSEADALANYAELEAEAAREEDARERASFRCEEMREESRDLLAQLLSDRRALARLPGLVGTDDVADVRALEVAQCALRGRIAEARERRAHLRVRRRELAASPWLIDEKGGY